MIDEAAGAIRDLGPSAKSAGAGALVTAGIAFLGRAFRLGPRLRRVERELSEHRELIRSVGEGAAVQRDAIEDAIKELTRSSGLQAAAISRIDERTVGMGKAIDDVGDRVGEMQRTLNNRGRS